MRGMTRNQRIKALKAYSREQDRAQALRVAIAILQRQLKRALKRINA